MKAIQLTTEHREKLLEMCKELFPEYRWLFHHHDDGTPDKNNPVNFNYLPGFLFAFKKENDSDLYDSCDIFIHWFEFCITYLCDKIFLPKGESRLDGIKGMDYYQRNDKIHPIDYLYSEFKKLKICLVSTPMKCSEKTFDNVAEIAIALVGDLLDLVKLSDKNYTYELTYSDMGLDDLDAIEFLMYVERDFGIDIDDMEYEKFIKTEPTLADWCAFIESKLNKS